jgi:hypothetical protein
MKGGDSAFSSRVREHLDELAKDKEKGHLVKDGLSLLS